MEQAVKDWYLIGEADYCMSSAIDSSTFAKTAIVRGRCVLIMFEAGEKCEIPSPRADIDKDWLLYMERGMRGKRYPWMRLPRASPQAIWSTVKLSNTTTQAQCINTDHTPYDIVSRYWTEVPPELEDDLGRSKWYGRTKEYTQYIGTRYGVESEPTHDPTPAPHKVSTSRPTTREAHYPHVDKTLRPTPRKTHKPSPCPTSAPVAYIIENKSPTSQSGSFHAIPSGAPTPIYPFPSPSITPSDYRQPSVAPIEVPAPTLSMKEIEAFVEGERFLLFSY